MCGKERERFLEIPSPDFTSLRSSPSGFADKVASVSESFGRVSECKVTKKKIALQKKSRKSYCFSVAVFRKLKMAIIAMIFCLGSLTHFVTGIVSHFCNSYMLQLCWNHKFRGFQKVSEGFNRWRWFQIVSEGLRWFQMFSRGKNKTLKTKTTFLKTIAMSMSKGSGWKPALSVTGDEVSG